MPCTVYQCKICGAAVAIDKADETAAVVEAIREGMILHVRRSHPEEVAKIEEAMAHEPAQAQN